jgi:hypothetical protein
LDYYVDINIFVNVGRDVDTVVPGVSEKAAKPAINEEDRDASSALSVL